MAEHGATAGMDPNERLDDREETVLATASVQATVDGATWTGTAEVLLKAGPAVDLECLFDRGVEPDRATAVVQEPGRITRLRVDGRELAGCATKATFFDDNDGPKMLARWRPETPPAPAAASSR